MDFYFDVSDALKGLARANDKVHRGIDLYGRTAALKMEAYAKAHRPWHDRTGNAKNTMKGIAGWGYVSADIQLEKTGKRNEYGDKMKVASVDNPNRVGYGNFYTVGITGNMEYSPYLEYTRARGSRYAILWPTVNALAGETIRGWAAMMNNIK